MPKKKDSGQPTDAKRLRYLVEQNPLMQSLPSGQVSLPLVEAPSLEGLRVKVPKADDPTEEDLAEAFQELLFDQAEKRERKAGEALELGDEVCLDVLGYSGGRLIPFSARGQMWTHVSPAPMLPGFFEALAGVKVGEGTKVELTLPADYPAEGLRGQKATFLVDVRAAFAVTLPDPESKAFLQKAGRGKTLQDVMKSLVGELEAELVDELWVRAEELVLDALVARAKIQVPAGLVDEEIRRRWRANEAPLLSEKHFSDDELKEALQSWLTDPMTRADASRRIAVSLVLRAVAQKEKLELTPQVLEKLIRDAGKPLGYEPGDLNAAFKGDAALAEQVTSMGFHLMAVGHVMSLAKVEFEGA